jgi:hypothetical protein
MLSVDDVRRPAAVSRVRARKLRVQYPGAIYHVINRGERREAIFLDDQDRGKSVDEPGACPVIGTGATVARLGLEQLWRIPEAAAAAVQVG